MDKDTYSVEIRVHTEDGNDYSEDHYDFDTRREAIKFARENKFNTHSVYFYPAGTDCNPQKIDW